SPFGACGFDSHPPHSMRPAEDVARVRELASDGLNHSQVARPTGVSRTTVRDWLRAAPKRTGKPACEACGPAPHNVDPLPDAKYRYPLGIYIGDKTISCGPRRRYRLHIFMDSRYSGSSPRSPLQCVRSCPRACRAPWQEAIVDRQPEQFIRGLIHSDG